VVGVKGRSFEQLVSTIGTVALVEMTKPLEGFL
jgi:hypothetical protein